ncbi:MAG: uroporphyrinogen decarboxylase [Microthrixaceae bacterium]
MSTPRAPIPASNDAHEESPFLAACRSLPHGRIPVWFMRQAGRSLPEYRRIRGEGSILEAIAQPDLATEITLQPVRRYGTDAAILYSDIMTPVHAVGFGVEIEPGVGPVIESPFRSSSDLDRLRPLEPDVDTPYVVETVANLVDELNVPLIGFAGAPYTVASYLVEGRPSRTYTRVKSLMLDDEPLWHALLERLSDLAIVSLRSQVSNGAAAVQLFDSWAGSLSPTHYTRYVRPHSERILEAVAEMGVPSIHFGVNTAELLDQIGQAGADVVGVDWRTPLDRARARVPARCALQGNLDPAVVVAGWGATRTAATEVLAANAGHPGHIFNLGHGVLPETDPAVLTMLVEWLHEQRVDEAPTAASS